MRKTNVTITAILTCILVYGRHGDYIKVTSREPCVIYGHSNATINRGGVRIGISEIYSTIESISGILNSLVVDL